MRAGRPPAARVVPAAVAACAVVALAACGGGEPGGAATSTGTATTGVTVSQTPSIPPSSPRPPRSDVAGRAFDFGAIVKVARDGGVSVLTFDRWTVKGLDDAVLARDGVVLRPHAGSPFANQSGRTYAIPVAEDAAFTYRHCVALDQPVTARTATLAEIAALKGDERLVLLTLDDRGYVTRGENDPAC